ncbi:ribosome-associated heat shock protein Hsp15 [Haloferula luteola]|uniref:Ribosome-associated heat shock protein Hsp15 n=1 Tax=Haloferula luteola TaxID=595692 RepID=A0A840VJW1_9BACT|nr:ribosome-associated heat shock protein Hsp15 [Haloferula luteola]
MRLDKWLWAVRLFKTRGLAAKACQSGRVKSEGRELKSSSLLRGGEVMELPYPEGPGTRVVRVKGLLEQRVSAVLAKDACEDLTPPEVEESRRLWREERSQRKEGDQGRPTKRNRRELEKGRGFFE